MLTNNLPLRFKELKPDSETRGSIRRSGLLLAGRVAVRRRVRSGHQRGERRTREGRARSQRYEVLA